MMRVSVFGATGSVGESTFDLLARRDDIRTVALTGGRNIARLARQARELQAEIAVTAHDDCYFALKEALAGTEIKVAAGTQALIDAADRPADWVMSAIVGAAGLVPGFRALSQGATLALANKESLVSAGPLMMACAAQHGGRILPVDSEHSAVFQALTGEDIAAVERVVITASGGPFRNWSKAQLELATLAQAMVHPNWSMGQRITIDSASMFNKALELIETREFFGLDPAQIETVVHPQSIVHALVGFRDGAMMAHMGMPDMRHAIGYALNWPDRAALPVPRLDLSVLGRLDFEAPDPDRFPALQIARHVMDLRGHAGTAFNAAKEVALDEFIAGHIGFMDMARLVDRTLDQLVADSGLTAPVRALESVQAMDQMARRVARELARQLLKN
ncbi:1-deoxy-D-xylulose-5-phosphate reductoisomerase [Roseinatronobacter alkalisoli]|uniref:1-deoxy-D-xylulose 5-phosphate reductoisomerase n=1 Tax=Roseinatronobacter alkalisoli TaxID=3028235 RepID=A0ABT5T5U9_9RHOB|nr:1-deoxy-D-xylulose-5-phosphate reductoisomerase [Roseinatronobacter sp. HJB301]MDD7970100.1 1-deoxy-D-xylulose-5-phosphate reductoisomerase [Roseinatronobacter sp. HJB301]